jgi:SAM-dependent methyltransferase
MLETASRPMPSQRVSSEVPATSAIERYWNEHIHDLQIAQHPVGTREFFAELDAYRFDKLRYLPKLVDFSRYRGRRVLEVGCGLGIDLVRFARGGAIVTGVDLATTAIDLARANFEQNGLAADLRVMDGEKLSFADDSFDVVYAHGVLPYAADPAQVVSELHRVLRPGGEGVFMVYNRVSWLNLMSKVTRVELEHEDAPVLRKFSAREFRRLLSQFESIRMVAERFPVETRLHGGAKAALYNKVFVRGFNVLPRVLVRPLGWHIMAFGRKGATAGQERQRGPSANEGWRANGVGGA